MAAICIICIAQTANSRRYLVQKSADGDTTVSVAHGLTALPHVSLSLFNTQIVNANLNANTMFVACVNATSVSVMGCSIICTAPASYILDVWTHSII